MPHGEIPEVLLEQLATIDKRLRTARSQADFILIHRQLNDLHVRAASSRDDVRARFFFLRALTYAKASRSGQSGFLRQSATESLQTALRLFRNSEEATKRFMRDHRPTTRMRQLEYDCVYEAAVVGTVLRQWSQQPDYEPDLGILDDHARKKIEKAVSRGHSVSSRY